MRDNFQASGESESMQEFEFYGGFIMKKKNDLVWSISLMVIGLATIILAGSNIVGIELPDVAVRIFGIVDLIALPFLAYSTVKKVKKE